MTMQPPRPAEASPAALKTSRALSLLQMAF